MRPASAGPDRLLRRPGPAGAPADDAARRASPSPARTRPRSPVRSVRRLPSATRSRTRVPPARAASARPAVLALAAALAALAFAGGTERASIRDALGLAPAPPAAGPAETQGPGDAPANPDLVTLDAAGQARIGLAFGTAETRRIVLPVRVARHRRLRRAAGDASQAADPGPGAEPRGPARRPGRGRTRPSRPSTPPASSTPVTASSPRRPASARRRPPRRWRSCSSSAARSS